MRDSTDIANAIEQVNGIVAAQNAALQSVKTALEGKAAGGGTDKMRLVKTIVLEEAVGSIANFSTDDSGNQFELKTVVVIISGATNGYDTSVGFAIRLWLSPTPNATSQNNGYYSLLGAPIPAAQFSSSIPIGSIVIDLRRNEWESATTNGQVSSYALFAGKNLDDYVIRNIAFSTNNGTNTMGAGTKIQIWGIDA